jgi:tetratricopeptide (TPR) repeat protein
MNNNNIRLQNLRDFTVQIRNAKDEIVGTGIAVSTDGKIVTCAHVVRAAGIEPRNADGKEVGIYFPQARGGEEKKHCAKVEKFFSRYDDDIVLLQTTSGSFPLAPEQMAVLGMADESEGNPFRTYGYSPIGNYLATRGDGMILGTIEPPIDRNLQVDPIQLKSRDIAEGMSGAAVLDVNRNLVVGLVAERYFPKSNVQDDIGFGVDSKVLTFDPFNFDVRGEALELKPAPQFRLDKDLFKQAIEIANYMRTHRSPAEKYSWNNAPSVLTEWTGRDELLSQITLDWNSHQKHVTGLIGFGGEGKSSLARKWVDNLLNDSSQPQPDGVFWWGFYENRSVDEFLEAALKYMSGGKIDPRQVQSSSLRAQIIGAMLGAGRYLFVLDGLEVMQHQDGDQYGLLTSNDLRDLLTFFARPDNQSFCLITSRAPLLDLMDYTTYTHRDVDRLSQDDGRALLRRLNVKGSDAELNKVVSDWDGHALTLSILAAYLVERYEGDVKHLADIPTPEADEPRYERVHRVLRRYDEHLSKDEREFLKLFSIFRIPIQESAFEKVFEPLLKSLKKDALQKLVSRLVNYRLIRHDTHEKTYTTHPLIRNHYFALFTKGDPSQEKDAHLKIKDYYLSIAGDTPQYPTLDHLKPLIEVVHHACQAGAYDEAWKIYIERISQGGRFVIIYQLGAYETSLNLLMEFFPDRDISVEARINNEFAKGVILGWIALSLQCLGYLSQAATFDERAVASMISQEEWLNASMSYQHLASLYISLGKLETGAQAANQALALARRAKDNMYESFSLAHQGHATHLLGELKTANEAFVQAEKLQQERDLTVRYLYSHRGINHAEHLRRTGNADYARRVTETNLRICELNHWPDESSQCHRILGDLDSDVGDNESSRIHYESALKIARSISMRHILIEALLARGRWQAKYTETLAKVLNLRKDDLIAQAFSDLNEALGYCVESGYRIYEADVRVALAWAYMANDEKQKAKESTERALQMSNEMKYYWGKVDAEEVLKAVSL